MSFSIDCLTLRLPSLSEYLVSRQRIWNATLRSTRARIIHRGSDYPCPPDRRPLASSCADPGCSKIQHPLGRDLHGSRSQGTSSHRERSYPQVVSTGLCRVVWVLGMSPLPLCTRPIRDLQLG